ncbi:sacsin N-terminal ATP-binding-like domain-containing protein [Desulfovibrio piger]|uniref:sacsin N-terminal ATP-binding-like domain-containing protein n=4 Tax=Desulfovibrio TaxID=872 RepID=UPI0026F08888|nr:hypothetical protein [Desulfovibrio piger]
MSADMQSLIKDRKYWVEANKRNGFEEGIKRLLTDLYPDRAHFIYELLQNAEDTKASKVEFRLFSDRVEFYHNGERLFNLKDVESITSIGSSGKRDDITTIGKFGVGFKAVFAYTDTPEIHSGEFHFKINDCVVPVIIDNKNISDLASRTCFIFPFNHKLKNKSQAFQEVADGLKSLADNTLLFLTHIKRIDYKFSDGNRGSIERVECQDGRIEIHTRYPNGKVDVSYWLRYQKMVNVDDEEGHKKCQIAIAYALKAEDSSDGQSWKIIPIDGQVSIYFPATKEVSHLKFHIHAPFASTVARDSVRDCQENRQLRNAIAGLVVDSLFDIRDKGMLTMSFLAVLPNDSDGLSPFYAYIFREIINAFQVESLTPTRSGIYAPAITLYRGAARIADVLGDTDLSLLLNKKEPLWVANPPQQNQRDDRFLDSLSIESLNWSQLEEIFNDSNMIGGKLESWLAKKDDVWLRRFYALLGEAVAMHYMQFHKLSFSNIVRTLDNEMVPANQTFFYPVDKKEIPKGIRFVEPTVYRGGKSEFQKKYARFFLEHIGVSIYDERAIIEIKLKKYASHQKIVNNEYFDDIKMFVDYWKKTKDSLIFENYSFLCRKDKRGMISWGKAKNFCLGTPFSDSGLECLYQIHLKHSIWDEYAKFFLEENRKDFIEFLKSIGVMHELTIIQIGIWENKKYYELVSGFGSARETYTAIREDYTIKDIKKYICARSIPASKALWITLIHADQYVAKARYRPNQTHPVSTADSQLIDHLKNNAWIPDKSGEFRTPQEMTRENLRRDFIFDNQNGLLDAIGFGENARKHTEEYNKKNKEAKSIGFHSIDEAQKMVELAKFMEKRGLSVSDVVNNWVPQPAAPEFPDRPLANPERRQKRTGEQLADSPAKNYAKRERSVRTTSGAIDPTTWLRSQYTNDADQMICQICKQEMPFRKRDGSHYFEKKELLTRPYLPKEHESQYLALCPLCAAKYDEFVKTDDKAMQELRDAILQGKDCEVPIALGGEKTTIRFVERHFCDLKVILKKS